MSGAGLLNRDAPVVLRVVACAGTGVVAGALVGVLGSWRYAPVVGWTIAAVLFVGWTWILIGRMSATQTATHATREDPTRNTTLVIVTSASVASLGGVVYLLTAGSSSGVSSDVSAVAGVASVAASWCLVHTIFTLRYARLYYTGQPGGVDFNQDEPPSYLDFAYLAFTIGMTYQVSDTDLTHRDIRASALRQALLSYLLGAVILAVTINLVAGLGNTSH